jgi:protein O-GlcNAc transferase
MRSLKSDLSVAVPESRSAESAAEAARLLARGEVLEAVELIEEARRHDPQSPQIRFLLAFAAWRMFDLVQAMQILTDLVDEAPDNGSYAEALATFKALVGDLTEALFLGKLGTALPKDPELQALIPPDFPSFGDAFLNINDRPLVTAATGLENQGRLREATRALEQHIRLFPDDRAAAELLTRLLLASGREAEAVQHVGLLARDKDAVAVSLLARASAAIGDTDGAATLHQAAVALAPDDAAIAAAAARDAYWFEADAARRRQGVENWVARFAAGPRSTRRLAPRGEKLRIGYLVAGIAGSPLAASVAAVARLHDRTVVEVYGYGLGELAADSNVGLRGGFDEWRDVSRIEPRTLARILEGDALDVVIDASGLRAPGGLTALSIAHVPLRCGWFGLAEDIAGAPYDYWLTCDGVMAAAGRLRSLGPTHVAASGKPIPRLDPVGSGLRIGFDISPRELTPATIDLLRRIFAAVPTAQFMILDHGFSQPIVVERLIAQLGDAAAHTDVVKAAEARAFLAQVDVVVVPPSAETPRAAAEAIGHGVPALVIGDGAAAAIARNAGLSHLVANDAAAAIATISKLAEDGAMLTDAWARSQAATAMFDGRRIAEAIADLARAESRHAAR